MRIIIHYDEIGLKGKNRGYFEKSLARNIRTALGARATEVRCLYGRIVCTAPAEADHDEIRQRLERLPGIAHFSIGVGCPAELAAIESHALELAKRESFVSFGVKASRSDKTFPLTSEQIGARVGAHLLKHLDRPVKVDLNHPDFRLHIEVTHTEVFLYGRKNSGPGGLPTGTGGKVLASLSGGIDSPVAAWMMMKRGCEVVFVHIRNETQFAQGAVSKIEELVCCLSGVQLRAKLHIVPFGELQRRIIAFVPAKYRMIVYRRFMMRILGMLAEKEHAQAIVTGDALGQAASQTLDNLRCIQAASPLPVLSPLIGFNKEETIAIARRIGTFEASTVPYPDCCSFMIAPHPETRADLSDIERYEAGIEEADASVAEAILLTETRIFKLD